MSDNDKLIADETTPTQAEGKPRKARKPPPWILPPDQFELSKVIARQLHEPERALIGLVINILGPEVAQQLLEETLTIEAQGGWMLPDQSRRRTAGGVFLFLAKQRMTREEQKRIHRLPQAARAKSRLGKGSPKPFEWEKRETIIASLRKRSGSVSTVKATLVGRATTITVKSKYVTLTLTPLPKEQTLPRGVPQPERELETAYFVLIGLKQWTKVKAALQADENDMLVVEGLCAFNEQLGGIAVHTTNVTTRNLQMRQRQAKESQLGGWQG